tara:strand:+ start:2030 stop:4510 length:2481 start_codon:yes stop_codon:yes gene_type:complete
MADIATLAVRLRLRDEASRGLDSFSGKVNRMSEQMGKAGRSMLALSAPILGIGVLGVKAFADFEKQMARAGAVSGATGVQMQQLEGAARAMGRSTIFTATQAGEALSFMAMAGLEVDQSVSALPSVLQLAAAGSLELGSAADIVTNVMAGMRLEVSDLARANDVLVTAFTSANTDLSQLGQAFKFAGPVAAAAGVSFEETSAALALMGNAGIQASMAGTGLRGSITKLLNPTKEAGEVLNRLGITVTDAAGKMLPLRDIVSQFEAAGLTAADAMTIFGQRAGPAMLALVSQGSDALSTLVTKMENSGGVAERISKAQIATLSGQFAILKSAVTEAMIALGEGLMPSLQDLMNFLLPLINSMAGFIEKHPTLAKVVLAAAAGVAVLGAALVGLSLILPGLIAMAPLLSAAFALVASSTGIGAAIIAISALIAVGVLLWKNWDTVKEVAGRVWHAIGEIIQFYINIYIKAINTLIEGSNKLLGIVGESIPKIKELDLEFTKFGQRTIPKATSNAGEFTQTLEGVQDHLTDTIAVTKETADAFSPTLSNAVADLTIDIGALGVPLVEAQVHVEALRGVLDNVTPAVMALTDEARIQKLFIDNDLLPIYQAWKDGALTVEQASFFLNQKLHGQTAVLADVKTAHEDAAQGVLTHLEAQKLLADQFKGAGQGSAAEGFQPFLREGLTAFMGGQEVFAEFLRTVGRTGELIDIQGIMGHLETLGLTMANIGKLSGEQLENIMRLIGGIGGFVQPISGFARGGVVDGPVGAPQLAMVHGGETITPPGGSGGGKTLVLQVINQGTVYTDDFEGDVATAVRNIERRGGFDRLFGR